MRKLFLYIFIVCYLIAQVWLMVSCYFKDAKFFGWQMYSHAMIYSIKHYGIDAEGGRHELMLRSLAPFFRGIMAGSFRPTSHHRLFQRGEKFFLNQASRLPDFLCRRDIGPKFSEIEIMVEHRDVRQTAWQSSVFHAVCP